jgi:hypothetical protein
LLIDEVINETINQLKLKRMKKNSFLGTGMVLFAVSLMACNKKTENPVTKPALIATQTGVDPTPQIQNFYQQMKSLRDNGIGDVSQYSINDAVFNVEGAYNYYVVQQDYNAITQPVDFEISTTANEQGNISANNVANVFWQIKSKLLETFNSIQSPDKALTTFDLEARTEGNNVIFSIKARFLLTRFQSNHNNTFAEAANHAWWIPTGSAPNYAKGQCDIDMNTKTAQNVNTTVPGAAAMLRQYGIGNYNGSTVRLSGYFVNNVTSMIWSASGPTSNVQSSYAASNIPGYSNTTIWNTYKFTNGTSSNWQFADADMVFKDYLTTPMMNFYLQFIPGIISSNTPNGKTLNDFNITWITCLCSPTAASTGNNPWPYPALRYEYRYDITYGNYVVTDIQIHYDLPGF